MPRSGLPNYISRIVSKKHNPDGRDKNIAWLNESWEGLDWIPADVRAASKATKVSSGVLRGLKAISELATKRNIRLTSLWEPGGCLRNEVLAGATIKNGPKSKNKPPKPWHLSRSRVLLAYQSLISSPTEAGDGRILLPGPKTGADCKEEAVASKMSSLSPSPPPKQRHPSPLHDTIASTEGELREPPRGTKRRLAEDNEDESLKQLPKKSQRVAVEKVLWSISPFRIESGHPELDAALVAKNEAEKALLDLLHRNRSVAISQAERVQARRRKLEAEEAFHQVYARLHRPSQPIVAMGNIKEAFDARAI
ncbi:hypothetical protein FAGAP_4174 [Fusarium agapanthi]|uniref:Uncharacterized protein n=1 Tax=Fusarium agapanthi TaxID=1803897 RepID=A0A9P5EE98_9HYPO|nr:hypothetical protein FAGAP_4174 [Fusarium agapanthi]